MLASITVKFGIDVFADLLSDEFEADGWSSTFLFAEFRMKVLRLFHSSGSVERLNEVGSNVWVLQALGNVEENRIHSTDKTMRRRVLSVFCGDVISFREVWVDIFCCSKGGWSRLDAEDSMLKTRQKEHAMINLASLTNLPSFTPLLSQSTLSTIHVIGTFEYV